MQIEPNGGKIAYYFYDTTAPGYHISNGSVKAKEWSHVAVVWNGKEANFYINGKKDTNVIAQNGPGRSNQEGVQFGGEDAGCCPRFFQGRIDEVVLANYPLAEADIQKLIKDALDVSATGKLTTTWGRIKSR